MSRLLALSVLVLLAIGSGSALSSSTTYADSAPPSTNDFIPDEQELSDCVGVVERPNCGSNEKGGWRLYLVMAALVGGLAFIFWRIARGIRARDAVVNS